MSGAYYISHSAVDQHNLKRPAYAHGPLALLNRKALEQFDADLLEKVVLDPQRDAVDKLNLKRPAYAHGPLALLNRKARAIRCQSL